MTFRRLWVLVKGLPPDSLMKRRLFGDEADWDLQAHLLAGVFDALRIANWQRSGDQRTPYPEPIPRPGAKPAEKKTETPERVVVSLDEFDRMLGGG